MKMYRERKCKSIASESYGGVNYRFLGPTADVIKPIPLWIGPVTVLNEEHL